MIFSLLYRRQTGSWMTMPSSSRGHSQCGLSRDSSDVLESVQIQALEDSGSDFPAPDLADSDIVSSSRYSIKNSVYFIAPDLKISKKLSITVIPLLRNRNYLYFFYKAGILNWRLACNFNIIDLFCILSRLSW